MASSCHSRQVLAAIKQIGFDDVIEVALGAEITAANEAKELEEKMEEGQSFMTTSCCPAYTGWVEKHAAMLKPFVSATRSPMVYAARYAKEKYPDAEVVFIGPLPCQTPRGRFGLKKWTMS